MREGERGREWERGRETHTNTQKEHNAPPTAQRGCDQSQIKLECGDKDTMRERERKGEI